MNIEILESLLSSGRILQYEIERKPVWVYVIAYYLEYDRDSPKGVCNACKGAGSSIGEAIKDLLTRLPTEAKVMVAP